MWNLGKSVLIADQFCSYPPLKGSTSLLCIALVGCDKVFISCGVLAGGCAAAAAPWRPIKIICGTRSQWSQ